jgi:hypothetical protein
MTVTTSVPKAPRGDTREVRALRLYHERRQDLVITAQDTYEVPSQDGARLYSVVYGGEVETCTCADFVYRNVVCIHLLAVGICRAKRRGGSRAQDHELIRVDARRHEARSYREHVQASRDICGETYVEDLSRISPAANAALSRELEDEEMEL